MSKHELIERIMRINRSARKEFLDSFSPTELNDYLRQLESIEHPLAEIDQRLDLAVSA